MMFWSDSSFQNLTGSVSSYLETLHDLVMVWLLLITFLVLLISAGCLVNLFVLNYYESEVLEKTWTIIPMLILVSIGIPSIRLLCIQDSFYANPNFSLKITSNQWNWQSEESDHLLDYDVIDNLGAYEVPVTIFAGGAIRFLLASTDVLHSLGIPSMGLKLDSIPGRLNSVISDVSMMGSFSGSCYELCGSGHGVMPINILLL